MKVIIGIILASLLIFTAFGKVPVKEGTYVEEPPTSLESVSGEYRAMWVEDYNYDTPILIDSFSDWQKFLENHPMQSTTEDVELKDYDNIFFQDNVIFAYIKSEGSGSNKLTVKGAELKTGKLELFMERIVPEVGTDDMATRICLFGIRRNQLKNVKSVEGIILE